VDNLCITYVTKNTKINLRHARKTGQNVRPPCYNGGITKRKDNKMSLELTELLRKCQVCNWAGDSWDWFCKVDKSHETREMWQYLDRESMTYSYSETMM
jgi:hypothetical protein